MSKLSKILIATAILGVLNIIVIVINLFIK